MTSVFRYVPHALAESYLATGWIFEGELPMPHGHYSALFRACECNPKGSVP